jgi:hypothetical protein
MKFLEDVSLSAYVTHATLLDSHDRAYTARAVDPALRRTHAVPWTSRHPLRVLFPFILPRFKVIPKGHTVFPSPVRARLTSKPTHIKHSLNAFLSAVNVGDYVVHGQLEAYSCAFSLVFPFPPPRRTPRKKRELTRGGQRRLSLFPERLHCSI